MTSPAIGVITRNENSTFLGLLDFFSVPNVVFSPDTPLEKIDQCNSLAILADDYPDTPTGDALAKMQELVKFFSKAGKRVFCEYLPLPGHVSGDMTRKEYTRIITLPVESPILAGFEGLSLLETHQNPFLLMEGSASAGDFQELAVFGRVAGVYNAIYGLPRETFTALGLQGTTLFSTIKISDFDAMEFRLKARFGRLLMNIIQWLCDGWHSFDANSAPNPFDNRNFMDAIKDIDEGKRKELYVQTITRGLDWFENAGMFVRPRGLGGVYEGFTSGFDHLGRKSFKYIDELGFRCQRADCTADTALAFFLSTLLPLELGIPAEKREIYEQTSKNLFKELYDYWQHYPDEGSILRGFFGWANSPYDYTVQYSDDNGRVTFECLLQAHLAEDRENFKRAYAAVNALRSTVGKNGHRWTRIDLKHFYQKGGRRWFSKHRVRRWRYHSPHYDAWTHAAVLYGAFLIQDQKMVKLISKGVDDYMNRFPKIHLEHSCGDDFSKLLVACSILYKCTGKEKHLEYVRKIIDFFEPYQDPLTGAFPEIDPFGKHARTEPSNESYGTGEAALYTSPDDTISDQLYSLGFLAIGLHLASKIEGIKKARRMLVKLLDYLAMIQLRSTNPQLDGAWTRGFDYRWGEPYGANGDVGWGAYSIETGWTMGPILSAFCMYLLDLDPFTPIEPDSFRQQVREDYLIEKQVQDELEKNWKDHTPRPTRHFTRMTREENQRSLQDFKCNSLDEK